MGSYVVHMEDGRNSLMHFGVLGMKWGVRRYQNKDGSLTPLGKQLRSRLDYFEGQEMVTGAAARALNDEINNIAASYRDKDPTYQKLSKKSEEARMRLQEYDKNHPDKKDSEERQRLVSDYTKAFRESAEVGNRLFDEGAQSNNRARLAAYLMEDANKQNEQAIRLRDIAISAISTDKRVREEVMKAMDEVGSSNVYYDSYDQDAADAVRKFLDENT